MSDPADEILTAGIRDAKTALITVQGFDAQWQQFAAACKEDHDLAAIYGQRLIVLVESAVDLYLASHRRMAQFEQLTKDVTT